MKIYNLIFLALLLSFGCADKKNQKSAVEPKVQNEKMMNEGFSKARILYDEEAEAPCDYLIFSGDQVMEPLELSKEFKQADLNVWIKFVPQRRQGNCEGTLPIELTEIKKRAKN